MMGSFRRPRPRFMSSPVLSDLARFHASSPALQISNTSVWNRWLLKTEMGSFITEYFQNQLLVRGLSEVLNQILHSGEEQLAVLADMWVQFFTETLPTLQAIFYPVQGQELTVRQMALLAFRDLVLLKLHLEESLGTAASVPPAVTQMLLVLQGIHESGGPSLEYDRLERLVEVVVSPYLSNVLRNRSKQLSDSCRRCSSGLLLSNQPEITISQHHTASDTSLAPLVEQEGEAYLEKAGGVRRHTVANAHSDVRLLTVAGRMHAGKKDDGMAAGEGAVGFLVGVRQMSSRLFPSQRNLAACTTVGVMCPSNS
ncbi:proline-rich protein 5-like isoform X4 [Betta splendens]|uniref:Proline-rich protein 5-like isoform X4 n=1 Tax=Betta splendens TaxID=158456 RepID=A0A9W2XW66_BETSP|nr:proline-rich protein 5-like isoform X4 [Betta splendens]